jgi:hypothetical protein
MTKQLRNHAVFCATFALLTLSIAISVAGEARATENPQPAQAQMGANQTHTNATHLATAVEIENWRKSILKTPRAKVGCFAADYPGKQWHKVPCGKPNGKLYLPSRGGVVRTEQVGGTGGTDFSAQVTGNISQAEGSFDNVAVSSESNSNGTANAYSLQLNTNHLNNAKACSTAPDSGCYGWEQFVYDSSGSTQIQYWLINWGPQGVNCSQPGTSCPRPQGASCRQGFASSDGWCPQSVPGFTDVLYVVDAASPPPASSEPATSLQQLKVTGFAPSGSTPDSMAMSVAGHVTTGNGGNYFTDLGSLWQTAEFNVFGDGGGDGANFSTGSTIIVRTSVVSGTSSGPICDEQSFTGESNNLILVATAATPAPSQFPSLVFTESNAPGSTQASCAQAYSIGDTHLTTFDGLYYDFQASGDFVLAQDGSDFIVQTRQASGAPAWPLMAVNKAVATQIGKTRVALYIEPTRLLINGVAKNLADGKSILLPTGVQVSRHDNVYVISGENGDNVRAEIQTSYSTPLMNITVGLGHTPRPQVRGLLGNPSENAGNLTTLNGVVLKEPVSFNDLYHTYTDSWRVQPKDSLFTVKTTIKPGIPAKPFFAKDLDPKASASALKVCKAAGITEQSLLDSCTLDTTVLNDAKAVKVFVHAPIPRHVIKPVLRGAVLPN